MNWEAPIESFIWSPQDELGNTRVEIRDGKKKFLFYMSIKGHEYHTANWLIKEMAPLVAKMMNEYKAPPAYVPTIPPVRIEDHANGDASIPNGNGSKIESEPKRRGNPNWIKGMVRLGKAK